MMWQGGFYFMGIGLVVTIIVVIVGFAVFGIVYGILWLLCYLKKKYCEAETFMCRLLGRVMCESCKEACGDHRKLLLRAILVTVIILASLAVGYCAHR
jgi:hypothetical protein